MQHKGLFITFEGPDGSGKTTCLKKVTVWLKELIEQQKIQFNDVFVTREPGGKGNIMAERIRNLVLDTRDCTITDRTEALLFAASRASHVELTIKPHLEQNDLVLSDRFVDSSLVYQGGTRNLGIDAIRTINDFATAGLKPDFTFLLMVSAETGLSRIAKNNRETNRLDDAGIEFHKKVQNFYNDLLNTDSDNRIILINANLNEEEVFKQVQEKLIEKLHINE
ncbi:dTMP kinase [Ureaplasma ceti]|uniref:Thymidylate kinase n=1 Tax=Ureaplasma ceti TaxID=3119530 RepID=A0ABP9U6C0_9BACT